MWKRPVGKHQNDDVKELPGDGAIEIFPGDYGGVESPIAYSSAALLWRLYGVGIGVSLDYLRYLWLVDDERARALLGFAPRPAIDHRHVYALPRKLDGHHGADAPAAGNQCHFVSRIHGRSRVLSCLVRASGFTSMFAVDIAATRKWFSASVRSSLTKRAYPVDPTWHWNGLLHALHPALSSRSITRRRP